MRVHVFKIDCRVLGGHVVGWRRVEARSEFFGFCTPHMLPWRFRSARLLGGVVGGGPCGAGSFIACGTGSVFMARPHCLPCSDVPCTPSPCRPFRLDSKHSRHIGILDTSAVLGIPANACMDGIESWVSLRAMDMSGGFVKLLLDPPHPQTKASHASPMACGCAETKSCRVTEGSTSCRVAAGSGGHRVRAGDPLQTATGDRTSGKKSGRRLRRRTGFSRLAGSQVLRMFKIPVLLVVVSCYVCYHQQIQNPGRKKPAGF